MNEQVELEQIKIKNCILEKENEILRGNISLIANEKKELLKVIDDKEKELEKLKESIKRYIREKEEKQKNKRHIFGRKI